MLTNKFVAETVNKPIDEPLDRYLKRFSPPFFSEPKFDGERVLIEVSDSITIANKHKTVYPEEVLPHILIKAIREAIHREGVYDGEFYSSRGNLYKFLSARARLSDDLALTIWDLFEVENERLMKRKALLWKFITPNKRVSLTPYTVCFSKSEIIGSFHRYLFEGYEGIVVKPNRSYLAKWLKLKEQYTSDMVVLAVKKTDSWKKERLPYTFLMGIYENGSFKRIGDVSSGLTLNEREGIAEFVPELQRRESREYIYLKPELVFEVEYHQKTENGLREPKIKRIRFDKSPKECDRLGNADSGVLCDRATPTLLSYTRKTGG